MRRKFTKIADTLETWLGTAAFASMFLAIMIQIFYRYLLDSPLVWPFEFSVYCYIYVIYTGAVMASRRQSHVSFDMLYNKIPERPRQFLGIITDIFVSVLFLLTIPASIGYIRFIGGTPSSSLDIPWGAVLIVYPVAMGLISLVLLVRAYAGLRGITDPGVSS